MFTRRVGGAGPVPVLGTDGVPTVQQDQGRDNVLNARFESISGYPAQRIAVAYKGPPGALTLPTTLYIWDDLSGSWYLMPGGPIGLVPGQIAFFDTIGLLCPPQGGSSGTPGALEAYFRVAAAGGDPAGTYTFALAQDMSA
jgi:hypothetical protein